MADKVEYSRLLIKRTNQSGTIPTIPPGGAGLTTFTPTDTFIGEFFLNQVDDSLWIRTSNGQIPILLSGSTPGGSGNCITDLYITNLYGCSPITLHDDFEVITNKLFRNQSGGQYDNSLTFGNSLFQDLIRVRAEDTSTGNESELRFRTNDGLGNAGLAGGVIGPNAVMNFGLTTDPNPSTFMIKQDLSNNFTSRYDVAGYSQSIASTDGSLNAQFFITDMTTPATSYVGCRYDDPTGLGAPFSLQRQNQQIYQLYVEDTTDRMVQEQTFKTHYVRSQDSATSTTRTEFGVEDTFIVAETYNPNYPFIVNGNKIYKATYQSPDVGPYLVFQLQGGLDLSLGINLINTRVVANDAAITQGIAYDEQIAVYWDGTNLIQVSPANARTIYNSFGGGATWNIGVVSPNLEFNVVGEPLTNINWKYYVEVIHP